MPKNLAWAILAFAVQGFLGTPAEAVFLDDNRLFKLTGTFYTQGRMRLQDSQAPRSKQIQPFQTGGVSPRLSTQEGNLVQWRNFAQPVFEGDLAGWMNWKQSMEELSFRFTGRFTWDGVFDYGPSEFSHAIHNYRRSARQAPLGGMRPVPVFQGTAPVERDEPLELDGFGGVQDAQTQRRVDDMELFDPRKVFGRQVEPWEIYVNFQKGPFFARIGKQNLSWGETDGLRVLDVINPIDNFFGLTFDEDLDEKRIPLWMVRANMQVIDLLGPLSSLGLETFWVPGIIDTTQGPVPFQSFMHPYAPPAGCDAQLIADNSLAEPIVDAGQMNGVPNGCIPVAFDPGMIPEASVKVSLYERLPKKEFGNDRFGARFVGVLFDQITFSLAAYRTWADIPQPRVHYFDTTPDLNFDFLVEQGLEPPVVPRRVVVELTHDQQWIFGGTVSFFQPYLLPGVIRTEAGYFPDEPGIVPILNFGDPFSGRLQTKVPTADYLRWMIGYDVFQLNVPFLSRTNNIILITQWFNSLRLTDDSRYRRLIGLANTAPARDELDVDAFLPDELELLPPAPKPLPTDMGRFLLTANPGRNGRKPILPAVFDRWNMTFSVALQAFLWHGNLIPQIVGVAFSEGDFGFLPNVVYRINDSWQVKLGYAGIYGKFSQLGLFRDRDQVGMRISYLLN